MLGKNIKFCRITTLDHRWSEYRPVNWFCTVSSCSYLFKFRRPKFWGQQIRHLKKNILAIFNKLVVLVTSISLWVSPPFYYWMGILSGCFQRTPLNILEQWVLSTGMNGLDSSEISRSFSDLRRVFIFRQRQHVLHHIYCFINTN